MAVADSARHQVHSNARRNHCSLCVSHSFTHSLTHSYVGPPSGGGGGFGGNTLREIVNSEAHVCLRVCVVAPPGPPPQQQQPAQRAPPQQHQAPPQQRQPPKQQAPPQARAAPSSGGSKSRDPNDPIVKLQTGKIPKEWKKVLREAGVKKKDLRNDETARLMYQLIMDHMRKASGQVRFCLFVCLFGSSIINH